MTLKPPTIFKSLEAKNVPALNTNITRAYQTRLESLNKRETSGITSYTYQSAEHGEVNFSANGSPTTVQTFAFSQKFNSIIYATAHAVHTDIRAVVTDVTNTSVQITCLPTSATTVNFCAITTATIKVFFQIIGSDP